MKKVYTKPLIAVEVMSLDQPIANGCNIDRDTMEGLLSVGLFTQEKECWGGWIGIGGMQDMDMNGEWEVTEDTLCYHSNVQIAFMS